MSHPRNRQERFLIGKCKGERRAKGYWAGMPSILQNIEFMARLARLLRNTTKLCSCCMCGNSRKFFNEKTLQEKRFIAG